MERETGELVRSVELFSHLQPSQAAQGILRSLGGLQPSHGACGCLEKPEQWTLQQNLLERELRARQQYWQLQEQEEQRLAQHLWHLSQELRFHLGHEVRLEVRPTVLSRHPHSFRNQISPLNKSPCFSTDHKNRIRLRAETVSTLVIFLLL